MKNRKEYAHNFHKMIRLPIELLAGICVLIGVVVLSIIASVIMTLIGFIYLVSRSIFLMSDSLWNIRKWRDNQINNS